jgi:AcrR family transcriptional regulator
VTIVDRAPLTRERVVAAALAFIDEHGVDALSMRKLGQQLGVEAMSLYNHVDSKDDLVDAVASRLLELVEVPDVSGDWRDRALAIADNVRAMGLAHPQAFPLLASRNLSSLESWGPIAAAFALSLEAGLSAEDGVYVVAAMCGLILGSVLLEISSTGVAVQCGRLTVADVPPDRPALRHYVESRDRTTVDQQYRQSVQLIIDGVERRLSTTSATTSGTARSRGADS